MQPPVYVGFWRRFIAFLLDSLVILPVLIALTLQLHNRSGDWFSALIAGSENFWLNYGLPAAFTLLFWLIKSATPGKMIVNAVIVDADTLNPPSSWQLVVRYLAYYLSTLVLFLGFIWITLDRRKQGWHDKLAGTLVIERQR